MDRYVTQLLADIAEAATTSAALPASELDDLEEVSLEEEVLYARKVRLSDRIGLPAIAFPPSERLRAHHISALLTALEDCLRQHGYFSDFPTYVPDVKRYDLLRQALDGDVPVLHHHIWRLDFCNGQPDRCMLGTDYCDCSSVRDETDEERYAASWDDAYWDELPDDDDAYRPDQFYPNDQDGEEEDEEEFG